MKTLNLATSLGAVLLVLPFANANAQTPLAQAETAASASAAVGLAAQSSVKFVPFGNFMQNTKTMSAATPLAAQTNRIKDAGAFAEMRQHILTMYEGVSVSHSFVLDAQHFDCIPTEQQPSVRVPGLPGIASPPPLSLIAHQSVSGNNTTGKPANLASQLEGTPQFDRFGNTVGCEAGTIPMRRITLEEMAHYPTLQKFFEKGMPVPANAAPKQGSNVPPAFYAHKYSYAYQWVNNLGGSSNLNLWRPYVNTSLGEIFSLSQEWYIGGSGAGTQTAEVGWQNYPAKYGSQNSALFIYWTADNYNGTGCYNLDCAAFVQTNSAWHFGGGWGTYSTFGGAQYDFSAEYYLYAGNWWLALGGSWVGYYPGSLYRGGQLSRNAQLIEFGSESVGSTVWPPEGSGGWANWGWAYAAYQRNIFYINTSGSGIWATLNTVQPSPACYSTAGPYSSTSSGWQVYFYLGGPGGSGC